MQEIEFFTRSDCHLCELARSMLLQIAPGQAFEELDIDQDPGLLALYDLRVPVLRRADGEELNWPFDPASLRTFLAAA